MAQRLECKMVGDYHVVTSPDVPGLCVADLDRDKAFAMVEPTVVALQRMTERKVSEAHVQERLARVA